MKRLDRQIAERVSAIGEAAIGHALPVNPLGLEDERQRRRRQHGSMAFPWRKPLNLKTHGLPKRPLRPS
jgi:hypothetical protein